MISSHSFTHWNNLLVSHCFQLWHWSLQPTTTYHLHTPCQWFLGELRRTPSSRGQLGGLVHWHLSQCSPAALSVWHSAILSCNLYSSSYNPGTDCLPDPTNFLPGCCNLGAQYYMPTPSFCSVVWDSPGIGHQEWSMVYPFTSYTACPNHLVSLIPVTFILNLFSSCTISIALRSTVTPLELDLTTLVAMLPSTSNTRCVIFAWPWQLCPWWFRLWCFPELGAIWLSVLCKLGYTLRACKTTSVQSHSTFHAATDMSERILCDTINGTVASASHVSQLDRLIHCFRGILRGGMTGLHPTHTHTHTLSRVKNSSLSCNAIYIHWWGVEMSKVILSECSTKSTAQSLGSIHRGHKATYRLLLRIDHYKRITVQHN